MLQSIISRFALIGIDYPDSEDLRLKKTLLLGIATMVALAGACWGIVYAFFGEFVAAAIPLSYAVISSLSIVTFALTRRYHFFRTSQLLLILFLPFLLMISLGGFISSSAVILWSLLAPLSAVLFTNPRQAIGWFLGYLGLVVLSGLLQPYVGLSNNLSPDIILFFFVINIASVSMIAFILLEYFVRQKDTYMRLLRVEQDKSEQLLLNVLPAEIASVLKNGDTSTAQQYDDVSILFADIVGFTPLSVQMTPCETVGLLNQVFTYFDSLVDKYDLEKIRTIGDSYMVVAGAPRQRRDHAQALARLALDMLGCSGKGALPGNQRLQFRIGINSGSVVAGVIGQSKFHYDVWSDAVNIASRMESHGMPDRIQIARPTYELIQDEFICEPRGVIDVKGRGEMETWFLQGVK